MALGERGRVGQAMIYVYSNGCVQGERALTAGGTVGYSEPQANDSFQDK